MYNQKRQSVYSRSDRWIPRAVIAEKLKKDTEAKKKFLWIGIACGLVVHVLGLVLFRVEPVPETPILVERPYLTLTSEEFGEVSRESFDQIALLDSAPLFLPSQWNTTSGNLEGIRRRRPADLFSLYPPELSFGDSPAAAELSLNLESIADSRDSLLSRNRFPFGSFGRYDRHQPGFPERFAGVAVYPYGGGEAVRQYEVANEDLPEAIETVRYSGMPVVFSVHSSPAGSLGPVLLVESSGSGEIDEFFRRKAEQILRETGGLESGYYRIEFGP